jgi:hypothetical protein
MTIAPGLAIGLLVALFLGGYVLVVGARRKPRPPDGGPIIGDPDDPVGLHGHGHGDNGGDGGSD